MSLKASSLFLALDTSFEKGSVGLFRREEISQKTKPLQTVKMLVFREWSVRQKTEPSPSFSHSERLIPEILSVLEEGGKSLSHLKFLAVSTGPGRFTGVRTAVNVARALAFSLKIPCYPLNSLRLTAENFLKKPLIYQSGLKIEVGLFCLPPEDKTPAKAGIQKKPQNPNRIGVTVAFNGFKNSVYFAEFSSSGKELTPPCVLSFTQYLEQIKDKPFCIGDIPHFYNVPPSLKKSCEFKEAEPSVKNLAPILTREFHPQNLIPWSKLQPLYLREDVAKASRGTPFL